MANARGRANPGVGVPIRVVAERTGLSPAALRAWERRYGVVVPTRSEGSQRVYSAEDIERLRLVARLSAQGHAIGELAKRSTATLHRMARDSGINPGDTRSAASPPVATGTRTRLERLVTDVRAFDSWALRASLVQAVLELGADLALETVISPFLGRIGDDWACGKATVAQEHMASAVVRDVLGWLLQTTSALDDAPTLVAATVAGEAHEFGAMMAAVIAARAGWHVLYLGANVPAADLGAMAKAAKARVVVLGIVGDGPGRGVRDEAMALRRSVGPRTRIVAGGATASDHRLSLRRAKIETLDSREGLARVLASEWTRGTVA